MFIFKKHISRRTVLKGAGVTVALPFLEAMVPAATAMAQTAANPKLRAGFFYIPHGAVQHDTKFGPEGDKWTPSGSGASFKLNRITAPLEPFKKYVSTIGNLDNPAGAGVHVRNAGTWLCCIAPPRRGDVPAAGAILAPIVDPDVPLLRGDPAQPVTHGRKRLQVMAVVVELECRDLPVRISPQELRRPRGTAIDVDFDPTTVFVGPSAPPVQKALTSG